MIDGSLRSALSTVAAAVPLLVASDFDGVLSPLVDDPAAASPDPAALAALVRLGEMPDTFAVAISGRSLATLTELTGDPAGVALIGTHGAEQDGVVLPVELEERVGGLHRALHALAGQYPGAVVETKPIGAAFHYRHVERPDEAAAAASSLAAQVGARTISGKMVVECLFGDVNKGDAVARLVDTLGVAATVYLGDDTTDEHAFAQLVGIDVGVKVGPGETCAGFRIDSQRLVAEVLQLLATERASISGSSAAHREGG